MKIRLVILFTALFFPSALYPETIDSLFEKNNIQIRINMDNEAYLFSGSMISYEINIPEGTVYKGLIIYENVKIKAFDSIDKKELPVAGPQVLKGSIKLKPAKTGKLKVQDLEFKFINQEGNFDITVDTLKLDVSSVLDQDSKLMDLSVPQFEGKSPLQIILIILAAVSVLTAVILFFIMIKQKETRIDPKTEFWNSWENLHEIRDHRKEFYIKLTDSIKKYAGYLSGENIKSFPFEKIINWISVNINLNKQFEHDFFKAYSEWEKIKFKKSHISDVYWRDDLKMIKTIFLKLEDKFQEQKK